MIKDPRLIEKRSFEIIHEELKDYPYEIKELDRPLVYRVIHTTADFEYGGITELSPGAVESGLAALKGGCRIYSDTRMIIAGVNKKRLAQLGCEIYTLVDDPQVAAEAKERGITRSIVGMERALQDEQTKIFIIGNAPTALDRLTTAIKKEKLKPALVIGVPVGFVGAAESKDELAKCAVPYVLTRGRKGGSTVAVSILNSYLYRE